MSIKHPRSTLMALSGCSKLPSTSSYVTSREEGCCCCDATWQEKSSHAINSQPERKQTKSSLQAWSICYSQAPVFCIPWWIANCSCERIHNRYGRKNRDGLKISISGKKIKWSEDNYQKYNRKIIFLSWRRIWNTSLENKRLCCVVERVGRGSQKHFGKNLELTG